MRAGRFDDEHREYVIETPKTPLRWINYIGTRKFGGFIDQVGSGVICRDDPGLNRIVKYLPQRPQSDFNGETAYIREKNSNDLCGRSPWKIYSPYYAPSPSDYESWECRVGLGYNIYQSVTDGIRVRITVFVPPEANHVVRRYEITNESDLDRELDLIPVVEFSHFDALKQFANADWVPQTMQAEAMRGDDASIAGISQAAFMMRGRHENWFAAVGAPITSFETDRELFLGDYGFGGWRHPLALETEELGSSDSLRGNNIAALMIHLGTLAPGENRTVTTLLGQSENADDAKVNFEKWGSAQAVEEGLKSLSAFWNDSLGAFQVETPSAEMNSLVNIHNARQCRVTANWSRYLSLYQLGLGARGMGFRDSSQDVMGILHAAPEEAKELLIMLLSVQKPDGSAMHQFYPLTMEANEGDSREEADRPDYYGDDHLWAVLAVCAYIRETGDYAFLDEEVPFYDKSDNRSSGGVALEKVPEITTVKEHLRRALAFTREHTGSHGLPLLGFADWNDTINLPTGAESMMIANLYGTALKEVEELLVYLTSGDRGSDAGPDGIWLGRVRDAWEEMADRFRSEAWDGEWWRRYYDAQGAPIGSAANEKGKIWLNAQSWPIISGFAQGERAETAMESAFTKLNTAHGIKLSWPGYNGYDESIGGASTYPPGAKENGGIFLHSNPWAMIAETILGRGERAWQYYQQINPAVRNGRIEEFEVEPYCYPQNILGDEHPQHGLGRNSWLSGTASWCWQAASQYILGIRPEHGGLRIDPCIPSAWKGFRVSRRFRGADYEILVENPSGVCKGVAGMFVDGLEVEGMVVPAAAAGGRVKVRVLLG